MPSTKPKPTPTLRHRSVNVSAPLLAATALALLTTGCRQPQPKRCVDDKNQVVDPSFCAAQNPNQPQNNGVYHPGYWPYHYYYGGSGGYAPGTIVTGGSTAPRPGVSYSTTTRGGFGSSFGGAGEGGSGHGGSGGE